MHKPSLATACVAVQLVEIIWEKSARGAEGGRLRGALPRAFALPVVPRQAGVLVSRHKMAEWDDWRITQDACSHLPPLAPDRHKPIDEELALRLTPDGLRAGYLRSPWNAKPPRHPTSCVLTLPADTTGQIVLNARQVSDSGQCYVEHTWNLFWTLSGTIAADIFLTTPPAMRHDARVHLF